MQEAELFQVFIKQLNEIGVEYMVTGSIASIIYSEPRLTHDVDIVLGLHIGDIEKFIAHFPLDEFYCPPKEIIALEIGREMRGHFNLIHHQSGFKADIYPMGKDELHKWAMKHKKKFDFCGCWVWVAPAEYVILRKLEYYQEGRSSKHLTDIRNLLNACKSDIDMEFLEAKIKDYNLTMVWKEVGL